MTVYLDTPHKNLRRLLKIGRKLNNLMQYAAFFFLDHLPFIRPRHALSRCGTVAIAKLQTHRI
jgi:hypothetical protein